LTGDVKFAIFELLESDKMAKFTAFTDFDNETFDATINLAEQIFADKIPF